MAKNFDDLITFLLGEIALCGEEGESIFQVTFLKVRIASHLDASILVVCDSIGRHTSLRILCVFNSEDDFGGGL